MLSSDDDRKSDENEEVVDEGAPDDSADLEPVKVPAPPPLAPRPAPPIQPASESIVPAETSTPTPPRPPSPFLIPPRSPEERPDRPIEKERGPPPPTTPRPIPSQPRGESHELHETPRSDTPSQPRIMRSASQESEGYEEDSSTMSFDFPRYTNITSPSQDKASPSDPPEEEILPDEDGGRLSLPSNAMRNSDLSYRSH